MRWLVAVALGLVYLVGAERTSFACSCHPWSSKPLDGASDVPLNSRVVVFQSFFASYENPRLVRVPDGAPVPVSITEPATRRLIVTPELDLEPDTTYQFVVDLLESSAMVVTTFTTGTTRDTGPPAFGGLLGLRLEAMHFDDFPGSGSCENRGDGWHGRILADLGARSSDVAYVELEWFLPADTERAIDRVMPAGRELISSRSCSAKLPPLVPFSTWCARAVAYDLAGNAAGRDQVACAQVVRCATFYDESDPLLGTLPLCVEAELASGGEPAGCAVGAPPPRGMIAVMLLGLFGICRRCRPWKSR